MGVTFGLSFNWPLKKTMDQESMTAFCFLYIKHFFKEKPQLIFSIPQRYFHG